MLTALLEAKASRKTKPSDIVERAYKQTFHHSI